MRRGFLNSNPTGDARKSKEPVMLSADTIGARVQKASAVRFPVPKERDLRTLKRSNWRRSLNIFRTVPRPSLRDTALLGSILPDPQNITKDILTVPDPYNGHLQHIWLKRGAYPVPSLKLVRRPANEAGLQSSTQTVCMLWPSAEEALFSNPSFPRPVSHLATANSSMEIRSGGVGGGFAMYAMRDIKPGERIAVEIPLVVLPSYIPTIPSSDLTYECLDVMEQAFESMLPEDQQRMLALYDGGNWWNDLKTLLDAIANRNQYNIGELPGGDVNAYYGCISSDLSRVNHSCAPNSCWRFDKDTFSLELRAMWPIRKSEELTISYIPTFTGRDERQKELLHRGFKCNCRVCSLPEAESREFDELRKRLGEKVFEPPFYSFEDSDAPGPELVAEAKEMLEGMDKFRYMREGNYSYYATVMTVDDMLRSRMKEAAKRNQAVIDIIKMVEGDESEIAKETLSGYETLAKMFSK